MIDVDEKMFSTPSVQYMTKVLPRLPGEGYMSWSTRFSSVLSNVERRQRQARAVAFILGAAVVAIRWESMNWRLATGVLLLSLTLACAAAKVVQVVMYTRAALGAT